MIDQRKGVPRKSEVRGGGNGLAVFVIYFSAHVEQSDRSIWRVDK